MAKKLTYSYYVGGKQVDKLTLKQKEIIGQRLGEALSLYYSQHPEEYKKLISKE